MGKAVIKVLYLYDIDGWALYNVGVYWSSLLKETHQFSFVKCGQHLQLDPSDYNYVLFGCTLLTERYLRVKHILGKTHLISRKWLPRYNCNFVSVIHDPCELFQQTSDWKLTPPFLTRLAHFSRLAVISNEMKSILANLGFECQKINTNSALPVRNPETIYQDRLAVFSRANNIPRKNLELFFQVKLESNGLAERFDGYFNPDVLSIADYIKLIDRHNCYICTSWQEGGPLTLMDAVHRGCAVLTTPVGQTDEWVQDGVNGFFCSTKQDFLRGIKYLSTHHDILSEFRIKSLEFAASNIEEVIANQLQRFLQ